MTIKDTFDSDAFAQCVRNNTNIVCFQNTLSKTICGDSIDKNCNICDALFKNKNTLTEEMLSRKNIQFRKQQFDMILLKEASKKIIFFHPLTKEIELIKKNLNYTIFTKQENKVVLCILNGETNDSIINQLTISKATLKTHLNHIYKKEPKLKDLRNSLKSI